MSTSAASVTPGATPNATYEALEQAKQKIDFVRSSIQSQRSGELDWRGGVRECEQITNQIDSLMGLLGHRAMTAGAGAGGSTTGTGTGALGMGNDH